MYNTVAAPPFAASGSEALPSMELFRRSYLEAANVASLVSTIWRKISVFWLPIFFFFLNLDYPVF